MIAIASPSSSDAATAPSTEPRPRLRSTSLSLLLSPLLILLIPLLLIMMLSRVAATAASESVTSLVTAEDRERLGSDYVDWLEATRRARVVDNSFNVTSLKLRANHSTWFERDPAVGETLATIVELYYRKLAVWMAGEHDGFYIKTAAELEERLAQARRISGRDCRRRNVLLYMCMITKYDAVDLQEWILWQLVVVGAQHLVIYVNDPTLDNTVQVLEPFVVAGYVTMITSFTGPSQQNFVYSHCINLIKQKSCYFNPFPREPSIDSFATELPAFADQNFTNHFLRATNCNDSDYEVFRGYDRPVWMAGFDSDEFLMTEDESCFVDRMRTYLPFHGLMIPWYLFGHSGILSSSNHVVSSYTQRTITTKIGKAVNRIFYSPEMRNSHQALYKYRMKYLAVNESLQPTRWNFGPYVLEGYSSEVAARKHATDATPIIHPTIKLHHYVTKSIRHLIKKWFRGVADDKVKHVHAYKGSVRSSLRPYRDVDNWLSWYSDEDVVVDDRRAVPLAKIIELVLHGALPNETSASIDRQRLADELRDREALYDRAPYDFNRIMQASSFYFTDDTYTTTPYLAEMLMDYLYKKRSEFVATAVGRYLRNETHVRSALLTAAQPPVTIQSLETVVKAVTTSPLLIIYTISSFDESEMQEWILWQLLNVGADHVVVYLAQSLYDRSVEVLAPFVATGFVTLVDMLREDLVAFDVHPERGSQSHVLTLLGRRLVAAGLKPPASPAIWIVYSSVSEFVVPLQQPSQDSTTSVPSKTICTTCVKALLADAAASTPPAAAVSIVRWQFGHYDQFLRPVREVVVLTYRTMKVLSAQSSPPRQWTRFIWTDGQLAAAAGSTVELPVSSVRIHHYFVKSIEHYVEHWVLSHLDYELMSADQRRRFDQQRQLDVSLWEDRLGLLELRASAMVQTVYNYSKYWRETDGFDYRVRTGGERVRRVLFF